ncbi:uncharacterized protein LOC100212700 isoform X2 [Hydra vulgaris]|uniref:Uncharacterized protein LOC100212700 isoform X2 n=1 Tax=Hydra vulgaris TaxID=6087 RepID=A0ABM4BJW0_HYDVU
MMFLKAIFIFWNFFICFALFMPINYKNKSTIHIESKRADKNGGIDSRYESVFQTTEESKKLPTSLDETTKMLHEYETILDQRQLFLTDSRDIDSMKKVFDIADDQVFDNNKKKILFKKIQKQISPQLRRRKEEIRKSVVQEVAKKIFPSSFQNEMHMAENLIKLSPEQIFNTALYWGVITSTTSVNSENTEKINDKLNKVLPPSRRVILTREDQRFKLPYFMTSLGNEENNINFWIRKENAKEPIGDNASKIQTKNTLGEYDAHMVLEQKKHSEKVNEITQLSETLFKTFINN